MNRIRDLRKIQKMTLKDLGKRVGLSESTISLYENGKREPDLETLQHFADIFHVSVDFILGRDHPDTSNSPNITQDPNRTEAYQMLDQLSDENYQALLTLLKTLTENCLVVRTDAQTDDFYKRYEEMCQLRGIDPCSQKTAELMGTTRANISCWKKGTKPSIDRLRDAANMLHTSCDYLTGRTDDPTDYTITQKISMDIPKPVMDLICQLDSSDLEKVSIYMRGLLDGDKYNPSSEPASNTNQMR